jgi:hypothetical protein
LRLFKNRTQVSYHSRAKKGRRSQLTRLGSHIGRR